MSTATETDRPDEKNSCFFQCDVQVVFSKVIAGFPQIAATAKFMNANADVLGIPLLATEQLPFTTEDKRTPATLRPPSMDVFEKKLFSMCTEDVLGWLAARPNVRNVYLYGLEAHICVLQTSLDLLRRNYKVYLVVDGVFSQRDTDRETAIKRLGNAGVVLTTAESALYEILRGADHSKFKGCLPAIKEFGKFFKQKQEESKL